MIHLLYDNLATPNLPNAKGLADHDNTREFLKNKSYPYTCTLTTDAVKGRTYFFSVCPEQYAYCMSLEEYNEDRITANLTPELITLLKDPEYSVYFLVFFPYEGFSLEYQNSVIIKFFNHLIEDLEIPKEKILFVYGDMKIKQNIKNYFINCLLPKENLLGLNIFEYIAERDSRTVNFNHPDNVINIEKNKRFFSLNAAPRTHRMYTMGALESKNLLPHFHYSWLNRGQRSLTRDHLVGIFKYFSTDEEYKKYLPAYMEFNGRGPVVLDAAPEAIVDRRNQIRNLYDLYADSYCSVITETQVDEYEVNMMFISEKTYKALYNFHPFLLIGCHGTLKYLRDRDYQTFPELFDESYDDLSSPAKRMNAVITEIEKFCNKDEEELKKVYYSDYFKDKLIHNWKNLLKRKGDEDLEIFTNWLLQFK